MDRLKEQLKNYNDDMLIDQYVNHKEEYTPEAVAIIETEIAERNLDPNNVPEDKGIQLSDLKTEDFKPLDHLFHLSDIDLVSRIFNEHSILFYPDNPKSSSIIPTVAEADNYYTFHIHKDSFDSAHELIDEHFEKHEGIYQLKKMDIKERLLALSFNDIPLSEAEAAESVDIELSNDEAQTFIKYGKRLISEGDTIEKEQERVLFYFDSIEELIGRIASPEKTTFTKVDLLALLEILQVYCNDSEFPPFMKDVIEVLLGFLSENS